MACLKLCLVNAKLGTRTQGMSYSLHRVFCCCWLSLPPTRQEGSHQAWCIVPSLSPSTPALMSAAQGAHVSGLFTVFLLIKPGPLLSQAPHLPRTFPSDGSKEIVTYLNCGLDVDKGGSRDKGEVIREERQRPARLARAVGATRGKIRARSWLGPDVLN